MSDGPFGVRSNERFPSTTYAIGIGLAASWDIDLAESIGSIGKDARARGIHFMLGPGVNIHRVSLNGRNFEYFGEDPFLTWSIAVGYIKPRGCRRKAIPRLSSTSWPTIPSSCGTIPIPWWMNARRAKSIFPRLKLP